MAANSGRNGVVSSFTLCCKTSWDLVTAQENPGNFAKCCFGYDFREAFCSCHGERLFFFGCTAVLSQARARWVAWDVTLTSLWGRAGHSRGDSAFGPESRCKSRTAVSGSNHRCMGFVVGPTQSKSVRVRERRAAPRAGGTLAESWTPGGGRSTEERGVD